MNDQSTFNPEKMFPVEFFAMAVQALRAYIRFFPAYLILSMATYLPFILLDEFISFDTFGVSGFLTARFFDVVVFISIPFLITNNHVSVGQVLQLFFQKFFGKIVLVCLLQFSFIFFTIAFFGSLHFALLSLGFFAYLFVLFAGIFMVFYSVGQDRLPPLSIVMLNSFMLVRNHFSLVFRNILLVSVYASIPVLFFILSYTANMEGLEETKDISALMNTLMGDPGLKWGMVVFQTIIRPFESLFLGFLFLSIIGRSDREHTQVFFWGPDSVKPVEDDKPSSDEPTQE